MKTPVTDTKSAEPGKSTAAVTVKPAIPAKPPVAVKHVVRKAVKKDVPVSMTEWIDRKVLADETIKVGNSAVLILECGHLRCHAPRTNFRCRPCTAGHPKVPLVDARKAAKALAERMTRRAHNSKEAQAKAKVVLAAKDAEAKRKGAKKKIIRRKAA